MTTIQFLDYLGTFAFAVSGALKAARRGMDLFGLIVLAVVPPLVPASPAGRDWWVRSWDPSYNEVLVQDYASLEELADVVHDAGAQLGAGAVVEAGPAVEAQKRRLAQDALERLAPKVRAVAHELVAELIEEWSRFREGATTASPPSGPARPAPRVP